MMSMFISNRKELDTSTNVLLIPSTLIFSILVHSDYLLYESRLFVMCWPLTKCLGRSFPHPETKICLHHFNLLWQLFQENLLLHLCSVFQGQCLFLSRFSLCWFLVLRYQQGIDYHLWRDAFAWLVKDLETGKLRGSYSFCFIKSMKMT